MLLAGRVAGTLDQQTGGRLRLRYDDDYQRSPGPLPISLSMPLAQAVHEGPVVRNFCQGLLPDNEAVLERWGREFGVSAGNPFALLRHVGEDCAGAVQFVPAERVGSLLRDEGSVTPLSEGDVADRLRILRRDPAAWHLAGTGQFSLAGAQAKTAVHFDARTGQWGDPTGAVPTTHIIKPAISGFDEHDLNEHLCLAAADAAGLRAARSRIVGFGDERAVVVERFDRFPGPNGTSVRIHQEDVCQALGASPTMKYQAEGGPSPEQIIALIRGSVVPEPVAAMEVWRFVDALAFNWLVAGTDAHAKNYSLLVLPGQIRLAPLYDLASSLPYDDMYVPRLRLAMRIGSDYRVAALSRRHWVAFAEENGLPVRPTIERVAALAGRLPEAFRAVASSSAVAGLGSALPGILVERVARHTELCREGLVREIE
ncbi:serine/threonine-protein kinase HipA [Actinoplanes lutulentus]|uniref:type II toxin-antitoxin system HipA family toxin n=1 Tax=Actinoplanes lutulentus TaxID=1287878 RepID=UPI0017B4EE78|nr:type II toxin-antitoxin system HipA family toxin [Actinoplanes lutulentus]MBB2945166.1 serine/threonine-protein kinase HipA [Actinoplanes lutulentus]